MKLSSFLGCFSSQRRGEEEEEKEEETGMLRNQILDAVLSLLRM